jgi:hypothetical protein
VPLLSDHWMGWGPRQWNLASDCPWYAVCADGAHKGIFSPNRHIKPYHGHKRGQGWWTRQNHNTQKSNQKPNCWKESLS